MNMQLKPLTRNSFNYFLRFSTDDYAKSLHDYGEARDTKRAMQLAKKEIMPLVPHGLKTKNQFLYRAKVGDETIGWLWFQIVDQGKTGFLLYIVIDDELRGKGYGKELLKVFEEEAKSMYVEKLVLYVFKNNKAAVEMYKKNGWQIEKEAGFYDATETTRYKMSKVV